MRSTNANKLQFSGAPKLLITYLNRGQYTGDKNAKFRNHDVDIGGSVVLSGNCYEPIAVVEFYPTNPGYVNNFWHHLYLKRPHSWYKVNNNTQTIISVPKAPSKPTLVLYMLSDIPMC